MNKLTKHWPIKIALLLFCFLLIIYIVFNEHIASWAYPGSVNKNGELMKDFLSVSGGLAVLAGLYLSFVRSRALEETVKNQQAQIKNQNVEIELTRDSNLNDQFKNAVEHLGSEKEPIILGGVAELNQLAANQPEKFAQVVVNIYSSYCKSEAYLKKDEDEIKWSVIRAIVNNLCSNEVYKAFQVDLSSTNLFYISLNNCRIEGWNISNSKLPHIAIMVHFKWCNFSSASGFRTKYTDVHFEDCSLNTIFIDQGRWLYPKLLGSTELSVLAMNSEFHGMQMKSELLSSVFINCSIVNTTFEKEISSSTEFLCCNFENVKFRQSQMTSTKFDSCGMEKVLFRGNISSTSFRGVNRKIDKPDSLNIYNRLTSSLNNETDLSGISFQGTSRSIDRSSLTKHDAYRISKQYNRFVEKYSFYKSYKIKIPEEWKDAASEKRESMPNQQQS